MQEAKSEVNHWKEELGNKKQKASEFHSLYGKVVTWSKLFDTCNMAEKKMMVSQLIRKVRIRQDYSMEIDFNINVEQILDFQQPSLSA